MLRLTKLEEAFSDVAFLCGEVFLLNTRDSLRFVNELRNAGIPILGIEGFRVFEKGQIQPQQDHSIDFGNELEGTHQRTEAFLKERSNLDLWFEIVSADR